MSDPPPFEATRDRIVEEVLRFVRDLRAAGVAVPADGGLTAARALGTVGLTDEARARAALHAALVASESGREPFDRLFDGFWHRVRAILEGGARPAGGASEDVPEDVFAPLGGEAGGHAGDRGQATPIGATGGEATVVDDSPGPVRGRDRRVSHDAIAESRGEGSAATYSPAGAAEPVALEDTAVLGGPDLDRGVEALGGALAVLRGRRWQTGDQRPDVRRALRTSVTAGGAMLPVPEQGRVRSGSRATLLVDVSQSVLDTIDRGFLLRFLRTVLARWRRVRVFFFDTDVREVTEAVDAPSAEAALAALEDAEAAWGGGTQIGAAIETIRTTYLEAIDRRTAVLVISDGLEVGDVTTLEDGVAWLGDRSDTLLWLNPLAADQAYEPTVRGMAAALPHVDGLFAFADASDVTEIARQLRLHGPGGHVGYQFDPRRSP
ncbi:MAG: VWA domain-containing protein [Halobacteriaceae archaeon]